MHCLFPAVMKFSMQPGNACTACGREEAGPCGTDSGSACSCTEDAVSPAACRPSQRRVSAMGSGAVMAAASPNAALRAKMHSAANSTAASRNGLTCPCPRAGSGVLLRMAAPPSGCFYHCMPGRVQNSAESQRGCALSGCSRHALQKNVFSRSASTAAPRSAGAAGPG